MKRHYLKSLIVTFLLAMGAVTTASALETYDFQELCMKLGKGGPWAVNDGGDAGFTLGTEEAPVTMHFLGDYTDQGFSWNQRFAYEYVADRGKFTMRNKSNKKDKNCGMFSWDYAHCFSILGLKDGDKVTITTLAGTTSFVSTNVTAEVAEGGEVVSGTAYTISTTEETTRLDIQMAAATLISKIEIEPFGVETVPVITVTPKTLKLIPTATAKLTASVSPAAETQWSSSDESVATVAEDGTVTAIAAGEAIIANSWKSEISEATAGDACVITVADVDLSQYDIVRTYDFTTMGDVTLELQSEAAGAIWNDANSKNNNVFFCTNEGLELIAVQAAVASNKGWSIVDGQGLFLATGAGRCAAIGGIKAGQIVEFIYTGDGFYTRSDDDGIEKTALNEGVGRAIYLADEDGMIGFELIKGNAVEKIYVYEKAGETPAGNYEAYIDYDKSRLTGWTFPEKVKQGETLKVPYYINNYADEIKDIVVALLVNGTEADKQSIASIAVDEETGEGAYAGLFEYVPAETGTIEIQLTLDFTGAALDENGEHETEPVTIEVVDPSTDLTPVFENLAELKAYTATTLGTIKVKLQDAKVTFVNAYTDEWAGNVENIVLEDASAGYLLKNAGLAATLKAGQTLNGELVLTAEEQGMFGDIVFVAGEESMANVVITEGEVAPKELTAGMLGNVDYCLVEIKDAAISIESSDWGDYCYAEADVLGGKVEMTDNLAAVDQWPASGSKVNIIGYYIDLGYMQYIQPISFQVLSQPYAFVAAEWPAGDPGRISPDKVTVDADANTITVSQTGQNNVALIFRSSNVYNVEKAQRYFVIKGTGFSTAAGASYLWWLNNDNNGTQIEPTDIYEEDGQTVLAWDCATIAIGRQLGLQDTEFKDEGGWSTTFGLTLADETVPAVISYIGFEENTVNPVEEYEYEFIASEWPAGDPGRISPSNVVVDEEANTITVDATGDNNVALNFKTDKVYYIAEPVKYFVIQATGLSTELGKSYLWWLNAKNHNGAQEAPTSVTTDEAGLTTFVWEVDMNTTFASGFNAEGKSYLDGTGASSWGWTTTFGMTLADASVPAVISYIGYEPADSEIITAISAAKADSKTTDGSVYNLAGQRVVNAQKGLYIINGKKVIR